MQWLRSWSATLDGGSTKSLEDDSALVRQGTVNALLRISPTSQAVQPLIDCLDDSDPWVRALAASALGRIGPNAKAAIPVLKGLERSGDYQLRTIAADALKKIQGE